jgi:hypothetical protein
MVCRKNSVKLPREINDNVGINFIRLLQMAGMNSLEIRSAHFRFDRYWLVGVPLNRGIILLAVCDLEANCSLIATTAAMLAEELYPVKPEGGKGSRTSGTQGEGMRRQYAEIENALAAAIGPVAEMVMQDSLSRWQEGGSASTDRLPELLRILAEKLEDPGLARDFRSRLRHLS